MALIYEFSDSGGGTEDQSRQLRYLVTNAADYDAAKTIVATTRPDNIGSLVPQPADIQTIPGLEQSWSVTVDYAPQDWTPFDRDEQEFAIDMTEGTATITQALEHKSDYAATGFGTAPNHQGAINVNNDYTVDGVEYPIPSFSFTRTIYVDPEDLTQAYIEKLFTMKGGTNNATWTINTDDGVTMVFAAGEVRFLGAQLQKRGKGGNWPVVQRFTAEPNLVGATIGPFTDVNKLGSDYIWFEFRTKLGSENLISVPAFAHVEKLAPDKDFTLLVP